MASELKYTWQWDLRSSPEALWPLVSRTDRFNRDAGLVPVKREGGASGVVPTVPMSAKPMGLTVKWDEEPFEWVRPRRFAITRRYKRGPLKTVTGIVELDARSEGGTRLTYQIIVEPASLLGRIAVPIQIALGVKQSFERVFRRYDALLADGQNTDDVSLTESRVASSRMSALPPGGEQRLAKAMRQMISQGVDAALARKMADRVTRGDEAALTRIRPYALAQSWNIPRRVTLEACLRATRAGLLELRWDLLCPLCRGAKDTSATLGELKSRVHCEACQIDFNADFERLVEISFRPSPAIRVLDGGEYCIGSPSLTPHVVIQQTLAPGESRELGVALEPGKHRARALGLDGGQLIDVAADASPSEPTTAQTLMNGPAALLAPSRDGWPRGELSIASHARLRFRNDTDTARVILVERLAWTDDAATAADVIALQTFRDLFAHEALRPGEQISVGSICVVFTDLCESTQLYRRIGDAPAFGRVMGHFDVLRAAIAKHDGALVKTIGDAVMAVFRRPASAVRAMLEAQQTLAARPVSASGETEPLRLKAGIHFGPAIAVTLNDRLDYFGSTVNLACRLGGLSTGADLVLSQAVREDPEVAALLDTRPNDVAASAFDAEVKGFTGERFALWRVSRSM